MKIDKFITSDEFKELPANERLDYLQDYVYQYIETSLRTITMKQEALTNLLKAIRDIQQTKLSDEVMEKYVNEPMARIFKD